LLYCIIVPAAISFCSNNQIRFTIVIAKGEVSLVQSPNNSCSTNVEQA
jgi:hypothetical protein